MKAGKFGKAERVCKWGASSSLAPIPAPLWLKGSALGRPGSRQWPLVSWWGPARWGRRRRAAVDEPLLPRWARCPRVRKSAVFVIW